jgi:GrpB-like predicted nucleotidyltransferase (UPF0157 family)
MSVELNESITVVPYDSRWPLWYQRDAAEIAGALASTHAMEHFGSTAVPGMFGKPVIDILIGIKSIPLALEDRLTLQGLGYEYMGEAGVPGREYYRRRRSHHTNLAIVDTSGDLWHDNILLRDFLRADSPAAGTYGLFKRQAWENGARTLLEYSDAKHAYVHELLARARGWRARGRHSSEQKRTH